MTHTTMEERFDESFYEGDSNSVHCKRHRIYATPVEIKTFIATEIEMAKRELETHLQEAVDLMEDVVEGNYIPDSFTTQPWKQALQAPDLSDKED